MDELTVFAAARLGWSLETILDTPIPFLEGALEAAAKVEDRQLRTIGHFMGVKFRDGPQGRNGKLPDGELAAQFNAALCGFKTTRVYASDLDPETRARVFDDG